MNYLDYNILLIKSRFSLKIFLDLTNTDLLIRSKS